MTATLDDLIPHRPPMQLIDRVVAWDDNRLWAQVSITSTSAFLEADEIHAVFGLEYLAQAAAAFFTVRATPGQPPRPGMLVASRNFATLQPTFPLGSELLVSIQLSSRLPSADQGPGLVKFSGEIAYLPQPLPVSVTSSDLQLMSLAAIVQADLSVYL